ncbi:hypothetical protein ACIPJQ_38840 [Streptomyces griseoviridis]
MISACRVLEARARAAFTLQRTAATATVAAMLPRNFGIALESRLTLAPSSPRRRLDGARR